MIGGVAAGIARTYGIDVTLVRVAFVVAAVLWVGIPIYLVLWAVTPDEDDSSPMASALHHTSHRDIGLFVGLALLGIGALIAANHVVPWGAGGGVAGSLFLIAGGIAILVLRRPHDEVDDDEETPAPFDTDDAPLPPEAESTSTDDAPTEPVSAWTQTAPWPTARATRREARRERRARRPRSFLTPLTISVLLIGAGVTSLLQATETVDVNLTVVLAIATCLVGAVLVLSAWIGRAYGLIAIGVLLTIATAASATLDVPLHGGVGARDYHPRSTAELRSNYELAIGHMTIDLRDVPLANNETTVKATVGIGRLEISVPADVRVDVNAHSGAGTVSVFGKHTGGWRVDDHRVVPADTPNSGVLHIDASVGAGEVDVYRYSSRNVQTLIGG